ncbi:sulfur carrier protein ThiS [Solimicrobium silvestre]|uniref:ThiS: thiamine biosynthesis protein ThiS n=1 Tax=Solimicrobium silvestre TaxID=2099400 RepID=A0A2S9GV50_9BURK|nr:sulfur carrier protein ThiS [Solimicrobium silvestre]PRC91605.1 thiS: thiamine biosynthesis protein ThiS [Solimicrobium silvestre]
MMEIILNGAAHQLTEQQSVAELVAALNLTQQAIAVAVNRSIIARPNWGQHQLQAQDQVDVVRAIGGG